MYSALFQDAEIQSNHQIYTRSLRYFRDTSLGVIACTTYSLRVISDSEQAGVIAKYNIHVSSNCRCIFRGPYALACLKVCCIHNCFLFLFYEKTILLLVLYFLRSLFRSTSPFPCRVNYGDVLSSNKKTVVLLPPCDPILIPFHNSKTPRTFPCIQ